MIDRKPLLVNPDWDTLMKHEGKKKVEKDMPQLGVNAKEWYKNKICIHKKTKLCFLPKHLLLLYYKSIRIFIFNLPTCCHKCSYPIDQGAKQLFPSMCIVWCHGHYVSTILVVTQLWIKFCQTRKDIENLKW
jgi:hypothetical protein